LAPVLAGIPVLRLERFNKSGNAADAIRRKSFGPGENIPFSKTTDLEMIAAKLHQIPGIRDLRFSKIILEMMFSK
jgi:hypothetical protein